MPRRKKDPDMPKRPLSSYMFYSKERRPKLQEEKPDLAFGDYSKLIAAEWKEMTGESKEPYLEASKKDKVRYEEQLKEYKEKKRKEPQMHMPVYHPDMEHIHMHKNFTTQDNIDAHHQMRKHCRAFQDPNYQMQYMRHPQHQNFMPGYPYMMQQQGEVSRNQQRFPPYYMQNPQYPGSYPYRAGVQQQQQQQQRHAAAQFPSHYGTANNVAPEFPKEEGASRSKNATPSEAQQQRVQFYNQFAAQPPNYHMYSHQQMHQHQAAGHPHHMHYQTQFQQHHQHSVMPGVPGDQQVNLPRAGDDHPGAAFEDASKLKFGSHDDPQKAPGVGVEETKQLPHGLQDLQHGQGVQQDLSLPQQNQKSPEQQTMELSVLQKKMEQSKQFQQQVGGHFVPPVIREVAENKVLTEPHLKHPSLDSPVLQQVSGSPINRSNLDAPNLPSIESHDQNIKV